MARATKAERLSFDFSHPTLGEASRCTAPGVPPEPNGFDVAKHSVTGAVLKCVKDLQHEISGTFDALRRLLRSIVNKFCDEVPLSLRHR